MSRKSAVRRKSPKPAAELPKFVRAKLRVSDANDAAEREADQLASQAMHGRRPGSPSGFRSAGRPITEESQTRVRAAAGSRSRALSGTERRFYESRMGYDFSDVRIHDGSEAHRAAESLEARAFTIGKNIFLRAGEYQADSSRNRGLMAHELAHTMQNGSPASTGTGAVIHRQTIYGLDDDKGSNNEKEKQQSCRVVDSDPYQGYADSYSCTRRGMNSYYDYVHKLYYCVKCGGPSCCYPTGRRSCGC